MAYDPIERFRVLFLNAGNELIADEVMGVGTVSAVQAWPREILKRCLDLEATAILLVHNHPTRSERSRWITHKHAETLGNSRVFGLA